MIHTRKLTKNFTVKKETVEALLGLLAAWVTAAVGLVVGIRAINRNIR